MTTSDDDPYWTFPSSAGPASAVLSAALHEKNYTAELKAAALHFHLTY